VSKDNHGQTPAAWTGTFVIIAASVISTVGLVQDNWTMFGLFGKKQVREENS